MGNVNEIKDEEMIALSKTLPTIIESGLAH